VSTIQVDPTPVAATAVAPPRGSKPIGRSPATIAWLMLVPAGVLLITFLIIPIILTFILAFTNARLISPRPATFVGVDNFVRLFSDETFWHSLQNTVVFAIVIVPIQSAVALGLAVLVNKKMRGINFFRTVYFLPVVTSIVVVSMLWLFMYQPDGLINSVLARFGIHGPDWLGNPDTALFAIIVLSIWQACGMHMIIWLSGLQTIPGELYEAAEIDGATAWQKFRNVTLAYLRPAMVPYAIYGFVVTFNLFFLAYFMSGGGPNGRTQLLVTQAYFLVNSLHLYGIGAAFAVIMFFILLAITLVTNRLTRATQTYSL
jgi:multiple sugar transport system permease protein